MQGLRGIYSFSNFFPATFYKQGLSGKHFPIKFQNEISDFSILDDLEDDESARLDFVGDLLRDELGNESQGKLETGSRASARHDVAVDNDIVLSKR